MWEEVVCLCVCVLCVRTFSQRKGPWTWAERKPENLRCQLFWTLVSLVIVSLVMLVLIPSVVYYFHLCTPTVVTPLLWHPNFWKTRPVGCLRRSLSTIVPKGHIHHLKQVTLLLRMCQVSLLFAILVTRACNPSTWKTKTGGLSWVQVSLNYGVRHCLRPREDWGGGRTESGCIDGFSLCASSF